MRREGTRQPTEPAPEVERGAAPGRSTVVLRVGEHRGDLVDASGEELVDVPTPVASVGFGEDGPEGVDPAPVLPRSAVPVAGHPGNVASSRCTRAARRQTPQGLAPGRVRARRAADAP
jgi:hypothetical protein